MAEDFREHLYTIRADGTRKWVYPKVVSGTFRSFRRAVALVLMAVYLIMPWITVGGKQAVRLDLFNREFTFLGTTFWATDSYFLVIILLGLAFSLFFFTAIFGRIWCGWACPETVFLEFLYRPIERLIEGGPAQRLRLDNQGWTFEKIRKKGLKYLIYVGVSWIVASSALAYFIGRDPLLSMMIGSPLNNWTPFVLTLIMMGVLLFQFGWFREQFCTALCPYARFQSVLLDGNSLLVGYDVTRGEPRGKLRKKKDVENVGDCVDCGLCVKVCPTGIDIRNGLQLECIQCAACADACDSVMQGIGKPIGLVRYDTEKGLKTGKSKIVRPRVIVYATFLFVLGITFFYLLSTRSHTDFQVLRGARDVPFSTLDTGLLQNHMHIHLSNKDETSHEYIVKVNGGKGINLVVPLSPFPVQAKEMKVIPVFFQFPQKILKDGKLEIEVEISDEESYVARQNVTLLGPE